MLSSDKGCAASYFAIGTTSRRSFETRMEIGWKDRYYTRSAAQLAGVYTP